MDDARLMDRIEDMVTEEHRLYEKGEETGGLTATERERLRTLQAGLDRCWDLLQQRRARREAGLDPDEASV